MQGGNINIIQFVDGWKDFMSRFKMIANLKILQLSCHPFLTIVVKIKCFHNLYLTEINSNFQSYSPELNNEYLDRMQHPYKL